MINLHNIVRGAVNALHPDEAVLLLQSGGVENVRGAIAPKFIQACLVCAQVQSLNPDELRSLENTARSRVTRKAWLHSPAPGGLAPSPLFRPLARAGDLLRRADATWWLVGSLIEDFSRSGWVCVGLAAQTEIPPAAQSLAAAWDEEHRV